MTTRMLRRWVPLGAGETPQSLASRLARRHGLAAQPFCAEMGLSFRKIVQGRPEALAGLAEVAGIPADLLGAGAFVDEGHYTAHRGERLLTSQVRRYRMRFCPHCLRQDIAEGDGWGNGEASIHGRSAWLVEQLRTCPVHSVELATLASVPGRDELHDVVQRLLPVLPDLDRIASEATVRQPSGFERYLLGRLEGRRASPWLDGFGLHAAIMTCAGLGLTEASRDGDKVIALPRTDERWHSAEALGFEIAEGGEAGVLAYLERVHSTEVFNRANTARNRGNLRRMIGYFEGRNREEGLEPVNGLIARFMADRRAIGGKVLGVAVERKLHSLVTAGRVAGMSLKALRVVLAERGLLPEGHEGMLPGSIMVDAEKVSGILASLGTRWNERQVAEHLGVPVHQVRLLAIERVISAERFGRNGNLWAFDQAGVKRFLGDFLAGMEVIEEARPEWVSTAAASVSVGYPQARIIRLLADRRLGAVGRLATQEGIPSLRVDIRELRRVLPKRDLSRVEVREMLGVSRDTAGILKNAGHLRVSVREGDDRRLRRDLFLFEDVIAFAEKYVSIHNYARSLATRQDTARGKLEERGIRPALGRETCGTDFYLRSELKI